MALVKITAADLLGKGVGGMQDTPDLSTQDMQAKLDELVLSVIVPFFNNLIDCIENTATDDQNKIPTSHALTQMIIDSGGGDMLRAVYDADHTGIVDNAERLGGELPSHYATDILDTISAILSNSASGKAAGALPIKKILTVQEVTLASGIGTGAWVAMTGGCYQTVALTGATSASIFDWCLKPSGTFTTPSEQTADSMVVNAVCGTDTITFYATSAPTMSLVYKVKGA